MWRLVAERRGSSPGGPCERMWPGMNGELPVSVTAGPCGDGAAA